MAVSVYDSNGIQFMVGEPIPHHLIQQPLVTERKDILSFPFGDAEITHIAFSGIYIIYGDMQMRQSRILHFDMIDEHDLVEMHFTLAGNGLLKNSVNGNKYLFRENEHNMHYIPHFAGTGEYAKNSRYKFFEVHFTTKFFFELAKDSSPVLMKFAEKIAGNNISELSNKNLPITFSMHQCINEILHCRFTGGLKLLFLQSKCIELLALQAQAYEDADNNSSFITCKSDYDKDCIHFAREYLLQHAQKPPSLQELAKISGINEFKLKKGFKEVFDNTVFGYLSDYKLLQAKELLLSGNIPVKNIADELGYSSVQHFSNAFRKKFGTPPGKLKK